MTKIQYISLDYKDFKVIEKSTLGQPKTLDSYDINIIDLASPSLWINNGSSTSEVNEQENLKLLHSMIVSSKHTKFVYILPQNILFKYYGGSYSKEMKLIFQKTFKDVLSKNIGIPNFTYAFEPNVTKIGEFELDSSFYFNVEEEQALTKAVDSKKITTVNSNDRIFTTLDLKTEEEILIFLNEVKMLENDRKDIPQWMDSIQMFDDKDLLKQRDENNNKIKELELLNENLKQQLDINDCYKSILYSSGDYLVEVVFKILEEMLQIDLSEFEDKKKEDLLFKKDGVTFIGEIKGINSNVKSENVWQLEQHIQEYNQLLQDEGKEEENTKGLLIINHQRKKPLNEREIINNKQINLSIKYGSLIIETHTLLKMYESYRNRTISNQEILKLLKNSVGLLTF